MISSIPKPPHRLERLQHWMAAETVDCTIVLGADNVNHLCGYWRYFGGPSALVIGSDGERTLVVMRDEAPIASAQSEADEVLGYGERGFGINLDPSPICVRGRRGSCGRTGAAARLSVGAPAAVERIGARGGRDDRRRRRGTPPDQADQGLGRAREDPRLVRALLARPAGRRERRRAGDERDRAVHGRAVGGADRLGRADRVRLRPPLGAEHRRGVLSDPRCGQAQRRGGRPRDRRRRRACRTATGATPPRRTSPARTPTRRRPASILLDVLEQARTELVPGATGAELFANIHARVVTALPGGELPHHGGHAARPHLLRGPAPDPLGHDAARALDGDRGRAGRLLPGSLRRAGREHLRRHARRRRRAARGDREAKVLSRAAPHGLHGLRPRPLARLLPRRPRLRGDRDAGEGRRLSRGDRRLSRTRTCAWRISASPATST